jgi:hypothetical protein
MIDKDPTRSVPDLTDTIRSKPIGRLVRDDPTEVASPIHVVASSIFKGSQTRSQDYIPSAAKVAQMEEYRGKPKRETVHTREVVRHPGVDWMSAEDSAKRLKTRNKRLIETAKQIYAQHSDDLKRYRLACEMLNVATDEELADPTPRIKRALRIKKAGPVITKKKARRQALLKISRDL